MRKLFFLGLLTATSLTQAQQIPFGTIDSILQVNNKINPFSGVVLIAEKGRITYNKSFGYREFAGKLPMKTASIFELASVSKQFTAMVIMLLKEKGLLQYDDPVEKYLSIPYKNISVRNLLNHTSGLPDYQAIMDAHWDKTKVAGNQDIIEYLNQYAPPVLFEPGTKYTYSNTGYVLLASIAEKVTGRDFIEFCKEEIFYKLNMRNTAIRTLAEKASEKDFAIGHLFVKEKNKFIRADSFPASDYTIWLGNRKGPGRISSTAEDLLKWDQALYTEKLIRQTTLQDAFTPAILKDGKISTYGFGWDIIPATTSGKIVWHNGDNPGYKTQIMRFLDTHTTLIILCNNASDQFEKICKEIQAVVPKLNVGTN